MSKLRRPAPEEHMTQEQYNTWEYCEVLRVMYHDAMNRCLGEILTLVEASFSNAEQQKAFKDIVHRFFRELFDANSELSGLNFNRLSEVLDIGLTMVDMKIGDDGKPYPYIDYYKFGKFLPPVLGSNENMEPIIKK